MVEYLESVHKGEFTTGTMADVEDKISSKDAENKDNIPPTQTMPDPPIKPCKKDCGDCSQCKESLNWWNEYINTVDELVYRSNTHTCSGSSGCQIITKVGKKTVRRCKARFPREVRATTMVDPDEGYLYQKKGEAWINWCTPVLTYLMRCNTDVTSLLSGTAIKAVTAYVTDYITKQPLKTHTLFQAVKTVFSRNTELIASDIEKQVKARKVITKVVNTLTGKSEIGGPMACMYLLKHPDHYTNYKFRKFYWSSFVKEVERKWFKDNDLTKLSDATVDNSSVLLWEKNDQYFGVSAVEDYMHRPIQCSHMPLYDWARLACKEKIPKKLAEKLAKGVEHMVDHIITHEWHGSRVKF